MKNVDFVKATLARQYRELKAMALDDSREYFKRARRAKREKRFGSVAYWLNEAGEARRRALRYHKSAKQYE